MFDKLVQIFIDFISLAKFWFVIEPYEAGVVTTFGKPTRDIGPTDGWFRTGFHLVLPMNVEVVEHISTQKDTTNLSGQDLVTRDGIQVRIDAMFTHHIRPDKVRSYVFGVGEELSFVFDRLQASVAMSVAQVAASELNPDIFEPLVLRIARDLLNPYGLKIHDFHVVSLVRPTRTYRLITGA